MLVNRYKYCSPASFLLLYEKVLLKSLHCNEYDIEIYYGAAHLRELTHLNKEVDRLNKVIK